jgi:hypothetical protein
MSSQITDLNTHELTELVYKHVYGWKVQQMGDAGEIWKTADGRFRSLESLNWARAWSELYLFLTTKYRDIHISFTEETHMVAIYTLHQMYEAKDVVVGRALGIAALKVRGIV